MNEWLYKTDIFEYSQWVCLSNPNSFNSRYDWKRVYGIMPEVVGPGDGTQRSANLERLEHFRALFRRSLHVTK